MQFAQALLQFLQLLAVFLVLQGRRQIHIAQFLHLQQREAFLERFPDILALLEHFVNRLDQFFQGIPYGNPFVFAVKHLPGYHLSGLFHELVVCIAEELVFGMLPQIVVGNAPLGLVTLFQGMQPLVLYIPVDVQEKLQYQIAAVAQLPFKLVDLTDSCLVLLLRDVAAQILPHGTLHPA